MRWRSQAIGLTAFALFGIALWSMAGRDGVAIAQEKKGVTVLWMYGDENGETHLKDVDIEVSPLMGIRGAKRDKPGNDAASPLIENPGVQFRLAGKAQDHGPRQGDWRKNARKQTPQLIVVLKGRLEVETTDGQKRVLGPGDLLLEDDSYSKGHYSRAVTPEREQLFIELKELPFKRPS